jgi:cytochrome c
MRFAIVPLLSAAAMMILPLGISEASADDAILSYNTNCRQCHVTAEGDHRLGPSLHCVIGREAGTTDFPGYSSSMKGAGFTWDEETLDRFIENVDAVVPGTNMRPFPGVRDADERKLIIEHLKASC